MTNPRLAKDFITGAFSSFGNWFVGDGTTILLVAASSEQEKGDEPDTLFSLDANGTISPAGYQTGFFSLMEDSSYSAQLLGSINNKPVFVLEDGRLLVGDPSRQGTYLLKNKPGSFGYYGGVVFSEGNLYATTQDGSLWRIDGTDPTQPARNLGDLGEGDRTYELIKANGGEIIFERSDTGMGWSNEI